MTPEQKAAYVQGQVAAALIELEAMRAENKTREDQGKSLAYGYDEFMEMQARYVIDHNNVISFFRD